MTDATAPSGAEGGRARRTTAQSPAAVFATDREMMACTTCDALHEIVSVPRRGVLRCQRCGTAMLQDAGPTIDAVLATAFAMAILIAAAVFSPFLQISAKGLKSKATLLDVAFAFSGGLTAPLALAVLLMIVIVPIVRATALAYALLPLRLTGRLLPEAHVALRFACDLRPWSMAEVFIIGVVVALVKIGGMASVGLGAGFWELVAVVVVVVIEGAVFSERTLWRAIEQGRPK